METYTKFTFSEKRYNIWTMRSIYHNTPTINGAEQLPGLEFKASSVNFSSSGGTSSLSLDIASAYPADAKARSYRRDFVFSAGKGLSLTDTFELSECTVPMEVNFLCYDKPEISGGRALLGGKAAMSFDDKIFTVAIDEIPLTDPKINNDWQKAYLYRLRLSMKNCELSGKLHFEFTRAN